MCDVAARERLCASVDGLATGPVEPVKKAENVSMSIAHEETASEEPPHLHVPIELRDLSRRGVEPALPAEQDNLQRLYRDTLTTLQQMFWDTMVAKNETIAAKDELISAKNEILNAKREEVQAKDELIAELSRRAGEAESRATQALRCLAEINQEGTLHHPNISADAAQPASEPGETRRSWWRRKQT